MFCDQVSVRLHAGNGGDGCVSFRREKYVAHGGPDGGNGGRGGSIVLTVNTNLNSLFHLRKQKVYRAEPGKSGLRFDKAGRSGEDLILQVPPGTLVFDENKEELLADLIEEGESFVIAEGGKGGFGNAHFTSSTRQAPKFGEKGEPGREFHVRLEMQMVADVGIIGLPSVGKSTLISRLTDAKPKIAAYPFTTLVPNVGVFTMDRWGGTGEQTFVVADIPGLIEGAHEGKGLGHEFLRHISRTATLVHVLDIQSKDVLHDYEVISNELKAYDPELAQRPQLFVLNKIDTVDEETLTLILTHLNKRLPGRLFPISAVTGSGLKPFVFALWDQVNAREKVVTRRMDSEENYRVFRPHLEMEEKGFDVEKHKEGFIVKGRRIEQIVAMTDLENVGAVQRVYDVMEKMGILRKIRSMNPQLGDMIHIGEGVFEFRG